MVRIHNVEDIDKWIERVVTRKAELEDACSNLTDYSSAIRELCRAEKFREDTDEDEPLTTNGLFELWRGCFDELTDISRINPDCENIINDVLVKLRDLYNVAYQAVETLVVLANYTEAIKWLIAKAQFEVNNLPSYILENAEEDEEEKD